MDLRPGESNTILPPSAEPELRLLTELRPWRQVFFENLFDTLLRRRQPRAWSNSPPGKFWPDVFVPTGIPWFRMTESGILHVLAVLMLVTFTHLFLSLEQANKPHLQQQTPLHYQVSEYLPPMNTGSPPAPKPRKGDPLLAKQKIISLPRNPDNYEQTIVSPVNVKLPTNIPLPNVVAWTPVPGPPSASALRTKLSVPQLPASVIPPPPDQQDFARKSLPDVAAKIIGPAPDAQQLNSNRKLDTSTSVIGPPPTDDAKLRTPRAILAVTPSVIEPPPDANVSRNLGAMNVGKLSPAVAAPKLEVADQRAAPPTSGTGANGGAAGTAGSTAAAPPPVPEQGALNNGPLGGQLIALNLHPANVAPLSVPPGRREGEFAAGPEGKPGAAGTPDIKAGGTGTGGTGHGASGPGNGKSDLPTGIEIGTAPGAPPPGSVVVAGSPAKARPNFNDAARAVMMASAHPPRIGDFPPETSTHVPDEPKIEDKIFSGKKYYSMTLNMPNLASAGGSWIIRFAQLDNDKSVGELTAPVATIKVDPAYPAELIRNGVEGSVVLYAVIHKDGTVGEVRVLRGLQGRLDENARIALLRWKFRPGTKNGQAIDLEAVVQIPYKAARIEY